ncbi:hypothetical protein ACHAPW_006335 [Verticillium nonalfalfae]
MTSSEDAKRAVVAIGEKYGFVGEDIMEQIGQWNPSIRRTIEESMLAKDKLAAHSIKTLAKNIYGSDARFVFELLQNADDNRFTRAKANGALPFISFHVHPHRIVVECNEDGFTEKDLRAICSVGESTKSASRGYIGAKGIGFKSVFIAAWKVAIQSGHFSFYFKHEKGDLGLGMVLPVWENQAAALPGPLTRMTLHLHEQGEAQELEHLRQTIFRQLSELQHTSLLFLRNLRQISVAFYDEDGGLKSSKNFRVGDERDHTVLLETTSTRSASGNGSQTSTENKQYHVTRHMATNLSKSDNRDSANNTEAEVVLAFPLTSDSQPLIEQQEIFAFLPIRESNFKFTSVLDHHPAKWLGLFEYLWRHEESLFKEKQYLKEYLSGLQADELCKPPLEVYCELKDSYLPLPHLQQQYRRFMGNDSTHFPFLNLEGTEDEEAFLTKWLFLHTKFNVRKEDDTRFLLDMLFRISTADSTSSEDQMRILSRFFSKTLKIDDVSWRDLLGELAKLRDQGCDDLDRIRGLYLYLADLKVVAFQNELRQDSRVADSKPQFPLRKRTFEDDALIFVVKDGQAGWYKTSDCLWSSTTDISGKVTLNDDYEDLRELFVENLGVKTLTLQMVYDELLQTDAQASIDDVKATLWSLNALLQTEQELPDPVPLHRIPIFPVKYGSGNLTLRTIGAGFAIVDNESLADKFRSRIKLLDFSREEVLRLKPFIRWVGLANRYLSAAVRESTSVAEADSRPVSTPNHDIKRKAHAISRIAAHFSSPRYKAGPSELYQLLRSAVTTETTGISSVLRISQDGRSTELETAIGDLHIDDSSSHLTFFVPRHKKAREICYLSALPIYLASWLMRDPVTQIPDAVEEFAVRALVTILGADPASVDALLERLSIINISIPNEDVNVAEDEEDEASVAGRGDDAESLVQPMTPDTAANERGPAMPTETRLAPLSGTYPDLSSSDAEVTHTVSRRSHMAYHSVVQLHSMPSAYHATILQGSTSEDALYLRLLTKVVDAARQAVFPSQGIFDMSNLRDALPERSIDAWQGGFDGPDVESRFHSTSQLERDRKIGAAGELYVFELLSRLTPALHGWSRDNWQSTIRRYVTLHPDYQDMPPWNGRETADMTYQDVRGELTKWLKDHGYLDGEGWWDARPKYYIEVKTTTGPHNTPFYMSKAQYQRVRHAIDHSSGAP